MAQANRNQANRNQADRHIAAVRHFNRFYTQRIGVLAAGFLDSPFSLSEARVLYELHHRRRPTAGALAKDLGLDPGYLSRMLRGFGRRGLVTKKRSSADGRQSLLSITARGRKIFAPIEARTRRDVEAMIAPLGETGRRNLVNAMRTVEHLLGAKDDSGKDFILRPPTAGDWGWVVSRHAAIYRDEYGWNEQFEALVAEIVAEIIRKFDPKRERAWIAERNGEPVGSVFLVKDSDHVARLRLLLVEPSARGLGIGARLVAECERFARAKGYRKITLWTHGNLLPARRLYERAGYRLVHAEKSVNFGHRLVSETWELKL